MHVAYKGAAPALQDVIAGHVQMMFATAASVVGHIRDGHGAPAGRDDAEAHRGAARHPDHGRARHSRVSTPPHGMDWSRRPARRGGHRDIAPCDGPALDDAAVEKSLGDLGVDIIGGIAAGIRRLHQIRNSEMDRNREGVGREARLTALARSTSERSQSCMDGRTGSASPHKVRRLAHLDLAGRRPGDGRGPPRLSSGTSPTRTVSAPRSSTSPTRNSARGRDDHAR